MPIRKRPYPSHTSRFRGDVAAVLNRLVSKGLIVAYKTNIPDRGPPDRLEIFVAVLPNGKPDEEITHEIRAALGDLHSDIQVSVRR